MTSESVLLLYESSSTNMYRPNSILVSFVVQTLHFIETGADERQSRVGACNYHISASAIQILTCV